jgi:hypothetical protein
MPHTVRVRASLARRLLTEPNVDIRRRIAVEISVEVMILVGRRML